MAGKSTEQAEIEKLIRLSAQARSDLGVKIGKFGRLINVPGRMIGSVRHRPKFWLFGSMAAGLAGSVLLNQIPRPRRKKRTSFKRKALSLSLKAAKPVAKMWLGKKLKDKGKSWLADRINSSTRQSSPFRVEPESKSGLNIDPTTRSEPNPYPANVRTPGP